MIDTGESFDIYDKRCQLAMAHKMPTHTHRLSTLLENMHADFSGVKGINFSNHAYLLWSVWHSKHFYEVGTSRGKLVSLALAYTCEASLCSAMK
eukprot:4642550-Amphidinium_carterae.1